MARHVVYANLIAERTKNDGARYLTGSLAGHVAKADAY